MKRKAVLSCVDEDEDDDHEDARAARRSEPEATRRKCDALNVAPVGRNGPPFDARSPRGDPVDGGASREGLSKAHKKEKEFAWMDSEDEDEEEDKVSSNGDEDENAEVSVQTLDDIQSFGRMMLLIPALQKQFRDGKMDDVAMLAAAYRALKRTKLFDREVLDELHKVLKKMLQSDKLVSSLTDDAIQCMWTLNDYDRSVFTAVAGGFRTKTALVSASIRSSWVNIFKGFGHDHEKDFIQLLEAPPELPNTPGFRLLRCRHDSWGICVLGDSCTYSHDPRAPFTSDLESLAASSRPNPVIMTQDQEILGGGSYGYKITKATGSMRLLGALPKMPK